MKQVNRDLVDVIKNYIKKNNISQKELSKLTGLSESSISKIFNYELNMRLDTLCLFCNSLQLDFNTLLSSFCLQTKEDTYNLLLNQILALKSKLNAHEKCLLIKTLVED